MGKKTSGIFLISNNKLLLVHPTNGGNKWSIPKGLVEDSDESILDAGIRELKEETCFDLMLYPNIIPEYLGTSDYKTQNKTLYGFKYLFSSDVTNDFKLKCNSTFIDNSGKNILENDIIKWVYLSDISKYNLHPTQIELLKTII